ncbi:hypothetical protein [Streptomyces sp. NPDC058620]|uniref:hypothetical protein n=1 Tax=Streptomyces sp. NPDC058620 TaxID=3346560 RepID=UPI00365419BD
MSQSAAGGNPAPLADDERAELAELRGRFAGSRTAPAPAKKHRSRSVLAVVLIALAAVPTPLRISRHGPAVPASRRRATMRDGAVRDVLVGRPGRCAAQSQREY